MQITAAVSRGPAEPFTIQTLELAAPAPGEVLVRLVATGVCHTDLTVKNMMPAEAGAVVLGHEGAGVVEQIGAGVAGVAVGDHVLLSFSSCGACRSCATGEPAYCDDFAALNGPSLRADGTPQLTSGGVPVLGSFFGQSSFASHVLVDPRNVVVVDDGLDLVDAAPLGCGLQTGAGAVLNVLHPETAGPDGSVVVFGVGGVGIAAVMAAAAVDVPTVIAVDLVAGRRAAALKAGATHVLDPADGDVVAAIKALTAGGATHALDTTGAPEVIAQAARALGSRGQLVVVGLGRPEVTLDVHDLLNHGKTVRGCIEGDADPQRFLPRLIELHRAGRFPYEQLIVRYPLDRINQAVADSIAGESIKPVLTF